MLLPKLLLLLLLLLLQQQILHILEVTRAHLTTTISTFDFSTRSVRLNSLPP
jgi:hypothetical protein